MKALLTKGPVMYWYPIIGWLLFGALFLYVHELVAALSALFVAGGYLYLTWTRLEPSLQKSTHWLSYLLLLLLAAITSEWTTLAVYALFLITFIAITVYMIRRNHQTPLEDTLDLLEQSQAKREEGNVTSEVDAIHLRTDDVVHLEEGDYVPADGIISHGYAKTDTGAFVNDSVPHGKGSGDMLSAGMQITWGAVRLAVVRTLADSAISVLAERYHQERRNINKISRIERMLWKYHAVVLFVVALLLAVLKLPLEALFIVSLLGHPLMVTSALRVWRLLTRVYAQHAGVCVGDKELLEQIFNKKVLVAGKNMYMPLYQSETELVWIGSLGEKDVWEHLATALQYGSSDSERAIFKRCLEEAAIPRQVNTYELVARGLSKVGTNNRALLVGTYMQLKSHGVKISDEVTESFGNRELDCAYLITKGGEVIAAFVHEWVVDRERDEALLDLSFSLGLRLARDVDLPCERDMSKSVTWIAALSEIQDQSLPLLGAYDDAEEGVLYAQSDIAVVDMERLQSSDVVFTSLHGFLAYIRGWSYLRKRIFWFAGFYIVLHILLLVAYLWFNIPILTVLIIALSLLLVSGFAMSWYPMKLMHAK